MDRFTLHCLLAVLTMQAAALAHIMTGAPPQVTRVCQEGGLVPKKSLISCHLGTIIQLVTSPAVSMAGRKGCWVHPAAFSYTVRMGREVCGSRRKAGRWTQSFTSMD